SQKTYGTLLPPRSHQQSSNLTTSDAMPPAVFELIRRNFDPGEPSQAFWSQWKNPSDVFSVLLILGGDVVARALAQLSGSGLTPVVFSFGTPTIFRGGVLLTPHQDG